MRVERASGLKSVRAEVPHHALDPPAGRSLRTAGGIPVDAREGAGGDEQRRRLADDARDRDHDARDDTGAIPREELGWQNHLTRAELVEVFQRCRLRPQVLWRFDGYQSFFRLTPE